MCELLGISSRFPATLRLSLGEFARHGGGTAPHGDGWGIALYEQNDVRVYREPGPAVSSPLAQFVETHEHESKIAIAHVRHATQGERALRNTQPFVRELGGVAHTFAHNGDLASLSGHESHGAGFHRPIGDTDSEIAFTSLLHALESAWLAPQRPPLGRRLDAFRSFCATMVALGPANFLYSDSEYLFVHSDRRKQPSGGLTAPGLWVLERACVARTVKGGGAELGVHSLEQQVLLVASVPLTDEPWRKLPRGEILIARDGVILDPREHVHLGEQEA